MLKFRVTVVSAIAHVRLARVFVTILLFFYLCRQIIFTISIYKIIRFQKLRLVASLSKITETLMTQSTLQAYGYENSNFSPNYVIFKKWLILLISPWVNFYLYYENNITMILIVFCSVIFHSLQLWKYFHYIASEAVNPRQAAVRKIKETALYCGNGQAPACPPGQRRFNPYMLNYSI